MLHVQAHMVAYHGGECGVPTVTHHEGEHGVIVTGYFNVHSLHIVIIHYC